MCGFVVLAGCTSATPRAAAPRPLPDAMASKSDVSAKPPRIIDPTYRVGARDVLAVWRRTDARPQSLRIESDGTIRIPDADPIRADNLTTGEIARELGRRFDDFKECRVEVKEYQSQFVYIFMADDTKAPPKAIAFQGRETVEELITRVGCKECKKGYRVRVVRPSTTIGAMPEIFAVKLDEQGRDRQQVAKPVFVRPNDYVYFEKDKGRPGEMTAMTESPWYRRPIDWMTRRRNSNPDPMPVARR